MNQKEKIQFLHDVEAGRVSPDVLKPKDFKLELNTITRIGKYYVAGKEVKGEEYSRELNLAQERNTSGNIKISIDGEDIDARHERIFRLI